MKNIKNVKTLNLKCSMFCGCADCNTFQILSNKKIEKYKKKLKIWQHSLMKQTKKNCKN